MTPSFSLPKEKWDQDDDTHSVFDFEVGEDRSPQLIPGGFVILPREGPRVWHYNVGLLNSYSVYVHACGLQLGIEKPLGQLFEDIDRYTFEPPKLDDLDHCALFAMDVPMADTQSWVVKTFTLSAVADRSIPEFPDEDFED